MSLIWRECSQLLLQHNRGLIVNPWGYALLNRILIALLLLISWFLFTEKLCFFSCVFLFSFLKTRDVNIDKMWVCKSQSLPKPTTFLFYTNMVNCVRKSTCQTAFTWFVLVSIFHNIVRKRLLSITVMKSLVKLEE